MYKRQVPLRGLPTSTEWRAWRCFWASEKDGTSVIPTMTMLSLQNLMNPSTGPPQTTKNRCGLDAVCITNRGKVRPGSYSIITIGETPTAALRYCMPTHCNMSNNTYEAVLCSNLNYSNFKSFNLLASKPKHTLNLGSPRSQISRASRVSAGVSICSQCCG